MVFEPYLREAFEEFFEWIEKHGILADGRMGPGIFEQAAVSYAAR